MIKPLKGRKTVPWSQRLAYELQDIFGENLVNPPHKSVAYKAILGVFKAMKAALLRGESVRIEGFGTFSVKTMKAHEKSANWLYQYDPNKRITPSMVPRVKIHVPERKYVHFRPVKSLRKFVEEGIKDEP